jgi:hypothetical protein
MKPKYTLIIILGSAVLLVTACNVLPITLPVSPESSPTVNKMPPVSSEQILKVTNTLESNTRVPTITATPDLSFLPDCRDHPKVGLPTETSPGRQGWFRYTNETYGFSFIFPPDWIVSEHGINLIYVCPSSTITIGIQLTIGVKRIEEDVAIQRTGVGAGDIITTGKIKFLGQEISRDVLRYQGKDKTILYHYGTEINVDGLIFTLSLDDFYPDYDAVELSADIQSAADTIVESFKLTQ